MNLEPFMRSLALETVYQIDAVSTLHEYFREDYIRDIQESSLSSPRETAHDLDFKFYSREYCDNFMDIVIQGE